MPYFGRPSSAAGSSSQDGGGFQTTPSPPIDVLDFVRRSEGDVYGLPHFRARSVGSFGRPVLLQFPQRHDTRGDLADHGRLSFSTGGASGRGKKWESVQAGLVFPWTGPADPLQTRLGRVSSSWMMEDLGPFFGASSLALNTCALLRGGRIQCPPQTRRM